jgi:hypothetical protein
VRERGREEREREREREREGGREGGRERECVREASCLACLYTTTLSTLTHTFRTAIYLNLGDRKDKASV